MTQKKALGRGLGSIISSGIKRAPAASVQVKTPQASKSEQRAAVAEKSVQPAKIQSYGLFSEIAIDKIIPSPYQARREFSEAEIGSLADSIASEGLIQPLLVRNTKDGYELIAGERRLRACRKLGMKKVVACVQTASDASAAAKGLIENLQRSDLNPIEEALGISNLMANFRLTQEAAAQRLGKPRSSVANSLRLLKLPEEVRGYIAKGQISMGHAKILTGLEDSARIVVFARQIIERGLNVRNTEDAVRRIKNSSERRTVGSALSSAAQNAVIRDIQNKVASKLNASVSIQQNGRRGKIVVEYLDNDDLARILETIGVKI